MTPADVESPRPSSRFRHWLSGPLAAALVGALCFLTSLSNDFTYDDRAIIVDNPHIRSLSNFREIWLSDWWRAILSAQADAGDPRRDRLYRPLTLESFALNYAVGGLQPFGFHLANLALHALACGLVWLLIRRLFDDRGLAACAALLFAVHPVHCEAVANVIGRAEVLAAVFLLAGLLALLPQGRSLSPGRAALSALCFLAALFSKETAVCYLPVALVALHATRTPTPLRGWGAWLMRTGLLIAPLAIYLPIRIVALDYHLIRDQPVSPIFNPLALMDTPQRMVATLDVVGQYARLLLLPDRLSCDYGLAVIDPAAGPTAMTLLGLLAVIAVAFALPGYRLKTGVWRQLAVLAAIGVFSYALISNVGLLIGVSLAERLMYWPSVPLLAQLAAGVLALWRRGTATGGALVRVRPLLQAAGVLLLVALALRTSLRNLDWAYNYRLFETDVATFPRSVVLNRAIARELLIGLPRVDEGQSRALAAATDDQQRKQIEERGARARAAVLDRAERYLRIALGMYPRESDALLLLARVYKERGDTTKAAEYAETSLQLSPGNRAAKRFLAALHENAPQNRQRVAELEQTLRDHPENVEARIELTRLMITVGRYRDGMEQAETAVRIAPRNAMAWALLGELLTMHEKEDQAAAAFEKVIQLDPNDWRAYANLANLVSIRDPAASLRYAERAYELKPDDLNTNVNLAEALATNGRPAEALHRYELILRGLADDDPFGEALRLRMDELQQRLR